jgi:ectoine hydroxylase-related dioxygenase (phytanoyl-CoA dioxygenase family)
MKFKNSLFQEQFDQNGYVTIPLLNKEEISSLKEYITNQTPVAEMANEFGFFQGVFISDREVKLALNSYIKGIIRTRLLDILDDFKVIIYTALAKGSNEKSQLALHQDASYVDENTDYSMSLWIPLSDSNLENGAIHILEGSHTTFPTIRCATMVHDYGDSEAIKSKMKCIEVKAGEALLFHSRLLHYTPKNTSGTIRMAVMSCLLRSDADILQWYKKDESTLEVFKMKDDFFLDFGDFMNEKDLRPKGEKLGEVQIQPLLF